MINPLQAYLPFNLRTAALAALLVLLFPLGSAFAQTPGTVLGHLRLGDGAGITGLEGGDAFGTSVSALGDLDGDGFTDLAVGAPGDDDGGLNRGAVYIVFLDGTGAVKGQSKISATTGGFAGTLANNDFFGSQVTALGDVDGDTVVDIAVTAPFADDGEVDAGAIWIVFLNTDGTPKGVQNLSATSGGPSESPGVALATRDLDMSGLLGIGDLDGDGVPDLALGAAGDDDGGLNRGAIHLLSLNQDGTVKATAKISDTVGGFTGTLDDNDFFGSAIGRLNDIDSNGTDELFIGTLRDDDGGVDRGAAWILFMNPTGTVITTTKISDTAGLFGGVLANFDEFGGCIAGLGDIDGDGLQDSVVGAGGDDDGGSEAGAVWILFQRANGSVFSDQKISGLQGGLSAILGTDSGFGGTSCAATGDLDGDARSDLAVGEPGHDGSADDTGAVLLLFLDGRLVTTTTSTTTTTILGQTTTTLLTTTTTLLVTTTSTTTTTLQPPSCGDSNGDGRTSATDALVALFAAVGALSCDDCICDTDGTNGVTATDALRLLQVAVGVPTELSCPPCT